MDLWIRSQTKHRLAKYNRITIEQVTPSSQARVLGLVSDVIDYEELGRYNTRERALEVLDEIQSLIQQSTRIIVNSSLDKKKIERVFDVTAIAGITPDEPPIIYPLNKQCVVYEMPQE